MKILFVSKAKPFFDQLISPIVKNQGDSLIKIGHSVDYYLFKSDNLYSYLLSVFKLRRYVLSGKYEIIHAHYSLTGILASLILFPRKKIVVSLMGSDAMPGRIYKNMVRFFINYVWKVVIVKSRRMKEVFRSDTCRVLPNGVDFNHFKSMPIAEARELAGFSTGKKHIVFIAEPSRREKNFSLASEAVQLLNDSHVELHPIYPVLHTMVPVYLNAADVLLLTSKHEGSPNIVKEAMACNIPIVATDVGDVRDNLEGTEGCYITTFDPMDVAEKLRIALACSGRTNGRANISHLESSNIARQLEKIYQETIA